MSALLWSSLILRVHSPGSDLGSQLRGVSRAAQEQRVPSYHQGRAGSRVALSCFGGLEEGNQLTLVENLLWART